MANHKSAVKRNNQSKNRRVRNRANRTKVKTVVNAVNAAIGENSLEKAQQALLAAIPAIHKAATKNAIPKKTASRKVSRLARRVNSFARGLQATS